jgi:hypothetical protein
MSVPIDEASSPTPAGGGSRYYGSATVARRATRMALERTTAPSVVRPVVALVANVTAVAALLYYFGWRRTATQDYRLGLNPEIFGLSAQDYILRSVGPVLRLLAVLGVAAMAAAYLDRWLWRRARRGERADRVVKAVLLFCAVAWLVLPALTLALNQLLPSNGYIYIAVPLVIAAGVLLLLYRDHMRRELHLAEQVSSGRLLIERASAVIIIGVAVFWAASNYAEVDGNRAADSFITNFRQQGGVIIYSEKGLSLAGVREERLTAPGSAYGYRYTGLWLVTRSGGHYFLVGDDWRPGYGAFIMLPDDDSSIRMEFVPGQSPAP